MLVFIVHVVARLMIQTHDIKKSSFTCMPNDMVQTEHNLGTPSLVLGEFAPHLRFKNMGAVRLIL